MSPLSGSIQDDRRILLPGAEEVFACECERHREVRDSMLPLDVAAWPEWDGWERWSWGREVSWTRLVRALIPYCLAAWSDRLVQFASRAQAIPSHPWLPARIFYLDPHPSPTPPSSTNTPILEPAYAHRYPTVQMCRARKSKWGFTSASYAQHVRSLF
jgi:hypothetical protein